MAFENTYDVDKFGYTPPGYEDVLVKETRYVADIIKMAVHAHLADVPDCNVDWHSRVDHLAQTTAYQLSIKLLKMDNEILSETKETTSKGSVTYPATWWDHFKKRFFPSWKRNDTTVEYVTHNITYTTNREVRLCHHLPLEKNWKHLAFLVNNIEMRERR